MVSCVWWWEVGVRLCCGEGRIVLGYAVVRRLCYVVVRRLFYAVVRRLCYAVM